MSAFTAFTRQTVMAPESDLFGASRARCEGVKNVSVFRVYASEECGKDGYPFAWHCESLVGARRFDAIKHTVRTQAGNRCVRCLHPYRNGEHADGEWSPCDKRCNHGGPLRADGEQLHAPSAKTGVEVIAWLAKRGDLPAGSVVEAQWRILTVHHLNGDKADCRWWNLASLCQRCHLTIQGRVQLHRVYPWEHSDWFKPYAAGWYAHAYLGEDLTREQTVDRLDELLALERVA